MGVTTSTSTGSSAGRPPEIRSLSTHEDGDRLRRQLFDVDGRSIVVTGAANGLGLAMSETLVRCGADVTMVDISAEALGRAQEWVGQHGHVRTQVADVTDGAQIEAVCDAVAETAGSLDVVFANAGIAGGAGILRPDGAIDGFDTDAFDRVIDVNLRGAVLTTRAAARRMKEQRRGKIVLTASATGLRPEPLASYSYVLSKAAVLRLVEQASLELTGYGVTINAIAPGPMRTIFTGALPDERLGDVLSSTVGLGRIAEPEELCGAALLLASPASDFMSGAVIAIDGGQRVSRVPAPAAS